MAMLAEGKSKTKWVLNPRGSNAMEGMCFGRKILEKMGWQSGDGLGVNKQGVTEPLRVSYKNDVKGIGYKKNLDNEWLKVEDEFSKILQNLSNGEDTNQKEETNIESLEKKSESSKARLHYRKFTRNKDLSRYSEKDLSCILGHVKSVEPSLEESKEDDKFRDKGTIDQYFESMAFKFSQASNEAIGNDPSTETSSTGKPKKKRKRQEESSAESVQVCQDEEMKDQVTRSESYGATEPTEESSSSNFKSGDEKFSQKKKSRNSKEPSKAVGCLEDMPKLEEESTEVEVKIKKKKNKRVRFSEMDLIPTSIKTEEMPSSQSDEIDRGSHEIKLKKIELKSDSILEVAVNNLEQNSHETASSFTEISDSQGKTSSRKKRKEKKLAVSNCDDLGSIQSPVKMDKNGKRKKKKPKEEVNETETMVNLPSVLENSEFSSGCTKHRKKSKKRKCHLSETRQLRSSSAESSSSSDDDMKIPSAVMENDTSLKISSRQSSPIERDISKKKVDVANEEILDSDVTKYEKGKKRKRSSLEENSEGAPNSIDPENTEILDSHNKEPRKKKKKSKHLDSEEVPESCEKVEFNMHESPDFPTDPDGNASSERKRKKSKRNRAQVENLELDEVNLENGPREDSASSKKKEKSSKALKSVTFSENTECIVDDKSGANSESNENLNRKKAKRSKKDKTQVEPLDFESTDVEVSISEKGSKTIESQNTNSTSEVSDLKCEIDPNIGASKKKKKNLKSVDSNDESTKALDKDKNASQLDPEFCDQADSSALKTTDKKAKLLAMLAKTTKDESDDSDSDSNSKTPICSVSSEPTNKKAKLLAMLAKTTKDESDDSDSDSNLVAPVSSVFKGSNFERIPGYRNVSAR